MMKPHIEGGDIVEPLHERVFGRVIAKMLLTMNTQEVIVPARYIA